MRHGLAPSRFAEALPAIAALAQEAITPIAPGQTALDHLRRLCELGLQHPQLRDEIWLQAVKQLNGVPTRRAAQTCVLIDVFTDLQSRSPSRLVRHPSLGCGLRAGSLLSCRVCRKLRRCAVSGAAAIPRRLPVRCRVHRRRPGEPNCQPLSPPAYSHGNARHARSTDAAAG